MCSRSNGFGIGYGISRNYRPIRVSVLVSDQNQSSGFGCSLIDFMMPAKKSQISTSKIKWIHLHLCFDRKNPANWFEICFLIEKVQNIELNFVFWQAKSNEFICICVLTEKKIQHIDLNFCFDVKIQTNLFDFVFWRRKSIWSIFTGYLLYLFKSNLLFDRKSPENWVEFCVLTGKIK